MGKYDSSELLEASRNGDYSTVEKIINYHKSKKSAFHSLRRGAGVNAQDSSGYNALHHASLNGHTDVVQLLLSHDGINPNALDQRGSSALHLAAWAGHTDICKLLLKHPTQPADPNIRTAEYETPLHFAAQHGHLTALIELLAKGADPNITNIREETPLDLAAQYGRIQIVQILIRAHNELLLPLKATATPIMHTALHLASRNGHRDTVELLLAAGCNVNILTPNGSAMHEAALCGKEKVVKVLLREGIDLDLTDRDGRTVFDLLNEFPQHVVNRIQTVINNHKPNIYDSESDDLQDNNKSLKYSKRAQSSNYNDHSSFVINHRDRGRTHSNSRRYQEYETYGGTTSPSSMGSFCGPSPVGHIVPITPRSAPLKPPRKSHSISPPSHSQFNLMTQSLDLDYPHNSSNDNLDNSSSTSSNQNQGNNQKKSSGNGKQQRAPYEFLYLSHSGESDEKNQDTKKKTSSSKKKQQEPPAPTAESDYIIMNAPLNIPSDYDSKIVRVANPHRKLRRSRDGIMDVCNDSEIYVQVRRNPNEPPLSPTHYPQAATPEHAPPSAEQAERYIHDRIRPLSQEYKRSSGRLDLLNKSPTSASSGSLSSVSISSSTDCVEEFHGDVPFAGLFKGSIMTLNHTNPSNTFTTKHLSTFSQHLKQKDEPSQQNVNSSNRSCDDHLDRDLTMSPFDEQEEWAKISEIMESFGSGIVRESVFVNDIENEFRQRLGIINAQRSIENNLEEIAENCEPQTPLKKWLTDIELEHLEEYLLENGYDNVDFLNGLITKENDLEICGIPEKDRKKLLNEIVKLPKPPTLLEINSNNCNLRNNNQLPATSVDNWLRSIQLEEYIDVFKKHLYVDMEKIYKVWEIELQAVLEINKIGHRKRILYSLIGQRLEPPNIEEINEDSSNILDILLQNESRENNNVKSEPQKPLTATKSITSRHKKKSQAPPPPVKKVSNDLEIRAPSELLLSNQGSLQAQWKHSATTLVSGAIKYEVFYLGSTVIKELRGTESTRKSIQKLKKGIMASTSSPSRSGSLIQTVKRPVCLAISHMGVQFIDIESQGTICEHNIKNIDCACQDAEDLSHFAYITKDFDNNIHYCHVFNVDSMDLATEIILTLGQAFEVAYQLALREPASNISNSGENRRSLSLASTSASENG